MLDVVFLAAVAAFFSAAVAYVGACARIVDSGQQTGGTTLQAAPRSDGVVAR